MLERFHLLRRTPLGAKITRYTIGSVVAAATSAVVFALLYVMGAAYDRVLGGGVRCRRDPELDPQPPMGVEGHGRGRHRPRGRRLRGRLGAHAAGHHWRPRGRSTRSRASRPTTGFACIAGDRRPTSRCSRSCSSPASRSTRSGSSPAAAGCAPPCGPAARCGARRGRTARRSRSSRPSWCWSRGRRGRASWSGPQPAGSRSGRR